MKIEITIAESYLIEALLRDKYIDEVCDNNRIGEDFGTWESLYNKFHEQCVKERANA